VIRKKYADVAVSAIGKFEYPTGMGGARALGYNPNFIKSASPDLLESFCGVGNPFSLGEIKDGETVLDIGSGAGFDLYVASKLVGDKGMVCGIDLTDDMVERAKVNLTRANVSNVEVRKVAYEDIPYEDSIFDVVISNGVINLSPDKKRTFNEIYRVLKSGGRLQFADVLLEKDLPSELIGSLEAWSQ